MIFKPRHEGSGYRRRILGTCRQNSAVTSRVVITVLDFREGASSRYERIIVLLVYSQATTKTASRRFLFYVGFGRATSRVREQAQMS